MKVVLTVASDAESERWLRAHFKFGVGIFRFTAESPNCFARRTRRKTPKALYTNSATGPREFWRNARGARRLRRFTTQCPAPFFHPKPRVRGSGVSVALRVRERSVRAFPKRSSGLRNLRGNFFRNEPLVLRRAVVASQFSSASFRGFCGQNLLLIQQIRGRRVGFELSEAGVIVGGAEPSSVCRT